jgi:hypothetical protein
MRRRDRPSQLNWLSARPEDFRVVGGLGVHRHCPSLVALHVAGLCYHSRYQNGGRYAARSEIL